jgi:hypothetical protein
MSFADFKTINGGSRGNKSSIQQNKLDKDYPFEKHLTNYQKKLKDSIETQSRKLKNLRNKS